MYVKRGTASTSIATAGFVLSATNMGEKYGKEVVNMKCVVCRRELGEDFFQELCLSCDKFKADIMEETEAMKDG